MSGASTEPCRSRRIPGLARCRQGQRTLCVGLTAFGRSGYEPSTEAMKRGQQLHPSRAPSEPQSGFLVQFLDKVVDVPAVFGERVYKLVEVPAAQVSPVSPAPVVETVVSHTCDR